VINVLVLNKYSFEITRFVALRSIKIETAKAMPYLRRLVGGFSPLWPKFDLKSGHVEFVEDKMVIGQVFSKYFDFPCQY
jgi:hypothetical protein